MTSGAIFNDQKMIGLIFLRRNRQKFKEMPTAEKGKTFHALKLK